MEPNASSSKPLARRGPHVQCILACTRFAMLSTVALRPARTSTRAAPCPCTVPSIGLVCTRHITVGSRRFDLWFLASYQAGSLAPPQELARGVLYVKFQVSLTSMSEIDIYDDMGGAGAPDEDEEALFGTGLAGTAATSSGNLGSNGNLMTSHGDSQSASNKGRAETGGGSEWAGAVLPGSNAGTANALHSHRQQVHSRA